MHFDTSIGRGLRHERRDVCRGRGIVDDRNLHFGRAQVLSQHAAQRVDEIPAGFVGWQHDRYSRA
jgi:hypothetical protein